MSIERCQQPIASASTRSKATRPCDLDEIAWSPGSARSVYRIGGGAIQCQFVEIPTDTCKRPGANPAQGLKHRQKLNFPLHGMAPIRAFPKTEL
jgi:hypothetical protein